MEGTAQGGYCAPGTHIWERDARFHSWLLCSRCGATQVCKACHGRGALYPEFPDVFCPDHAPLAAQYRPAVMTGPLLGRRVMHLAQTVRDYFEGWSPGEEGRRLRLVVGDLEVWLVWDARRDWARVVVLHVGRLVYHAEGCPSALVVRALVPGVWVNEVQQADTWVHGEVLR
jgi:hypothetical protein